MLPEMKTYSYLPAFASRFYGNNLFSNLLNSEFESSKPLVNILETKNDFRIELAAPGISKNDFQINLDNQILTISSTQKEEKEEKEEKVLRNEFCYSSFSRSFSLPETIDREKISASYKDGIIVVNIPKKEEAKDKGPKQIFIS